MLLTGGTAPRPAGGRDQAGRDAARARRRGQRRAVRRAARGAGRGDRRRDGRRRSHEQLRGFGAVPVTYGSGLIDRVRAGRAGRRRRRDRHRRHGRGRRHVAGAGARPAPHRVDRGLRARGHRHRSPQRGRPGDPRTRRGVADAAAGCGGRHREGEHRPYLPARRRAAEALQLSGTDTRAARSCCCRTERPTRHAEPRRGSPSRLGARRVGPYRWDRARALWSSNAVPEAVGSGWMRMVVMAVPLGSVRSVERSGAGRRAAA